MCPEQRFGPGSAKNRFGDTPPPKKLQVCPNSAGYVQDCSGKRNKVQLSFPGIFAESWSGTSSFDSGRGDVEIVGVFSSVAYVAVSFVSNLIFLVPGPENRKKTQHLKQNLTHVPNKKKLGGKLHGQRFRKCIFPEGRSKELLKMVCVCEGAGVRVYIYIYIYFL